MELIELLQKHETLKLKGYSLIELDLYEWVELLDMFLDLRVNLRSQYSENKLKMDIEKGQKKILLKEEKEDGKKKHTESTADAIIDELFFNKDLELLRMKAEIEAIESKTQTIPKYINIAKMWLKR